jgi:uncharacterized protein (TIGR02594 family)
MVGPEIGWMPPWLWLAFGELGETEVRGGENPRILQYHGTTFLEASEDEVPWCASFVCWVLLQSGYPHTGSPAARSYETFGQPVEVPEPGDIVVFARGGSPVRLSEPGERLSGHVGLYLGGFGRGTIHVLGGNQSNRVRVSEYDEDQVVTYRRPEGPWS